MSRRNYIKSWIIIFIWLLFAGISIFSLLHMDKPFVLGSISDPTAESAIALETIDKNLSFGTSRLFILYQSDKYKATDPVFVSEVNKSLKGLKNFSLKHRVTSPYENPNQISDNKKAAFAVVTLSDVTADQASNSMDEFRKELGKPKRISMYIGGEPLYVYDVNKLSNENLVFAESIALPLSIIALIFIFRGFLAAFLPLISGLISITVIVTVLYILGHQFQLSVLVLNIATMLGLGLTLDYTLLITYRYREELARGHSEGMAIRITLRTAGKAVLFSGLAVLASMASLIFFPINVLYSIGVAGVVVVAVAVMSALSFLPAALYILGSRINAWSLRLIKSTNRIDGQSRNLWFRMAKLVMKHPYIFIVPTILFLLFLGYPFLNVKMNRSDATLLPAWVESRQLIDKFSDNFNVNDLTPIEVLLKSKNKSILTPANISSIYDFSRIIKNDKRVARVNSLVTLNPRYTKQQYQMIYSSPIKPFTPWQKQSFDETTKGKYTLMTVISKYPDNDQRTYNLVSKIRTTPIGNNITKQVTGASATIVDSVRSSYILFIKMIVVISIVTYLVLLILLRSIILPLKAILMNFLSLSVCYGMLVFIFQEGHFANLLGIKALGSTDLNLPIVLFFGLFGLSMDYEVFLLTRIKEFYDKTKNNELAVALGIERSARIITSAALLVVIVALAFITADIVFIKAFGLGTALAVAVDASIIRLILVPATMRLLGEWNWYIPKWLDRILPRIKFE